MKRKFLVLMSFILTVIFLFASCGGTTECTEHTDENGDGICDTEGCGKTVEKKPDVSADALNENGELYLFKGGVPTFQFVIGNDAISKHRSTVEDLAEVLLGLSTEGSEIKTLAQGEGTQDVEILVGTVTNRGDEYNINKYDYGNTGYVVKQIGTKIVVTGGSDTAIANALSYLKTTVFGIKKNNEHFADFVMAADKSYEVKQTNYTLKEITIAGNSIKDYVITYSKNDDPAETNAENLQKNLYDNCGIRLEILQESRATDKSKIVFRTIENDGEGGGFYVTVDEDKNLVIECEYASKSVEYTNEFFNKNVFNKRNTLALDQTYTYAPNYRDIYYKDYAVGNGVTDDFFALKTVHDLANENLLNVHADPNQTYYIGNANGNQSITVKTNTYWHGCKFIFDDEVVAFNTSGRTTPIFVFEKDAKSTTYFGADIPIKSLKAGQTNIGWEPGTEVMLVIYDKNVRHYIRSGLNASQSSDPSKWGDDQHELIIVDAKGNVDPMTPIQWDYSTITEMRLYPIDDREIEVRGEGENGELTTITTWYNNGPGSYMYYSRNLYITRSNMVISGIHHVIDKWVPYNPNVPEGNVSPYAGFTQVRNCNKVILDNFIVQNPEVYYDIDPVNRPSSTPSPTGANMGSYELDANLANNVTWMNIKQSNFFNPDGTVKSQGDMGTNFCKNLTFDSVFNCSFDAHCGVYNGTIKNSTLEHINYIGAGTINLENVTVYADGSNHTAINLRYDYGSTWNGDVNINGLVVKHRSTTLGNTNNNQGGLRVINGSWTNWFYGYTTYLPQNISIRNLITEEYEVAMVNGERKETLVAYNSIAIKLFSDDFNNASADYYRDKTVAGNTNKNPMVPTKKIEYFTEYTDKYAELNITRDLTFILPKKEHSSGSTMFRDTEYWIDGELQE